MLFKNFSSSARSILLIYRWDSGKWAVIICVCVFSEKCFLCVRSETEPAGPGDEDVSVREPDVHWPALPERHTERARHPRALQGEYSQYVNLTYTDPHYPNVTRNALVIRGPSRVSILRFETKAENGVEYDNNFASLRAMLRCLHTCFFAEKSGNQITKWPVCFTKSIFVMCAKTSSKN